MHLHMGIMAGGIQHLSTDGKTRYCEVCQGLDVSGMEEA